MNEASIKIGRNPAISFAADIAPNGPSRVALFMPVEGTVGRETSEAFADATLQTMAARYCLDAVCHLPCLADGGRKTDTSPTSAKGSRQQTLIVSMSLSESSTLFPRG